MSEFHTTGALIGKTNSYILKFISAAHKAFIADTALKTYSDTHCLTHPFPVALTENELTSVVSLFGIYKINCLIHEETRHKTISSTLKKYTLEVSISRKDLFSQFTNPTPGVPISFDEASKVIEEENGIISGVGRTLMPGFYCVYGAFPGCLRDGKPDLSALGIEKDRQVWYKLTLRDVVLKTGFYPDTFSMGYAINLQNLLNDYSVNFDKMTEFCINSPYTTEELKDPRHAMRIWGPYFNNTDN